MEEKKLLALLAGLSSYFLASALWHNSWISAGFFCATSFLGSIAQTSESDRHSPRAFFHDLAFSLGRPYPSASVSPLSAADEEEVDFENLRVGLAGEDEAVCSCCQRALNTLHGYLFEDDKIAAIYYLAWSKEEVNERVMHLALSYRFSGQSQRQACALELVAPGGDLEITVSDDHFFLAEEELGSPLSAQEVMATGQLHNLWALVEVIVENDPRVNSVLSWLVGIEDE